ncbi:transglutaminase domain-containing protein [Caldilinea sp.]|uniref:transglutaminase domain-containing protein n=1 Tax=Caldilinea sp. TaxID=2293560 RepID=UPI002D1BE653|nr:transglutaminase domain-containing protein [Caldilinea sp.]
MNKVPYGEWSAHPENLQVLQGPFEPIAAAKLTRQRLWASMITKHEGNVLYFKLWNFWVRAGVQAQTPSNLCFRDYESANAATDALLAAVGFPWKKAETETEVWERIGMVWNWLKIHVEDNGAEYSTISSVADTWPSILDYAAYYSSHGKLVWAACFSKAHLFVTLLGRMVYPRYRFGIAQAHHTENGAPSTASHVYAGVYVGERWYYLDPTAIPFDNLPDFAHKASIGIFTSVDYEHPYWFMPAPLAEFEHVPYLPS